MRNILLPITAAVFITLTGCGDSSKPAGLPTLYPVEVKVIQDGTPLVSAQVQLTSSAFSWVAAGSTDDSGVASLWTAEKYSGAPAGHFKVTVTQRSVDTKFSNMETTPLTADIDSRTKMIEFDVSPAVKGK